jgi:hypothetical protein
MSYKYAVIWFSRAHTWTGKVRPLYSECRMFHSLNKAIRFSKGWSPSAKIYELKIEKNVKNATTKKR